MIDLSLAIYHINPNAEYRLSSVNPPHEILEWRGTGQQPTEYELESAYQAVKRGILLTQLDENMHTYLDERGYTRDEQIGFLAVYVDLSEMDTLTEKKKTVKARIKEAWTFVDQSILTYYYTKKIELEAASDVDMVTWDFYSLDSQDPAVSLQEIKIFLLQ